MTITKVDPDILQGVPILDYDFGMNGHNRDLLTYFMLMTPVNGEFDDVKGLGEIIDAAYARKGIPITFLDNGAGDGTALKMMLRSPPTDSLIGKGIGISRSHYVNLAHNLNSTGHSMEFHIGLSEEVLPELEGQVDVIADCYGAFMWTDDRIRMLQSCYTALADGGQALFFVRADNDSPRGGSIKEARDEVENEHGEVLTLAQHLEDKADHIFRTNEDATHLLMTKSRAKFPDINLRIAERFELPIEGTPYRSVDTIYFEA